MDDAITFSHVSKQFKILNRREGLKGSIKDLFSHDYHIIKAVNDLSFNINSGEIIGFLGPNGAGKSTTIKMMTGVLENSSGEININGYDPYKNRTKLAQEIGVVFGQRSQLWWSLPAIESFKILRDMYQVSKRDYKDIMDLYSSLVNIDELMGKTVRQMSLGQRTLSDILAAFLHNPSIVFLDEPTIGLDVSMKSKIRELIKVLNKKKGTTVILTTHDMGDVDALCKRIIIIDKGIMLYDNDIEHLISYFGSYRNLKIRIGKNLKELTEYTLLEQCAEIEAAIKRDFKHVDSSLISIDDQWINILVNEEQIEMMQIINYIQSIKKIYDLKIEEISTESVIKKIYDGGVK